jgi:hypothetical protein
MALVPQPVFRDANGNAYIPGMPAYGLADPNGIYEDVVPPLDIIDDNWADVSVAPDVYVPRNLFRRYYIHWRVHRSLKKVGNNRQPAMYELYIKPNRRQADNRDWTVRTLTGFRDTYQQICSQHVPGEGYYLGAVKTAFLQRHFPILGVRREFVPARLQNSITKISIFPASSRFVRQGLALSTFQDQRLRAGVQANVPLRPGHRLAAQTIWTSILMPFLCMIGENRNQAGNNDVDIRIVLTFIMGSNTVPAALFYLNFPVRPYTIDNGTNHWLREMQYYFLQRLIYTDISRTDSDRSIESLELVQIYFNNRPGNRDDDMLGGFLPTPIVDENTNQSIRAKETLKQNSFTWADTRGWYLASYKSPAPDSEGKTRKMCLYWACLKGVRLIELSHYDVQRRWSSYSAPTASTLQAAVQQHLEDVMGIERIDDSDGVSYGSPILQAISNLLGVDIRINDCNWNVLTHYCPDPDHGSNYPCRDSTKATAANRQIFSVSPVVDTPTIVLCLLEHPSDCMAGGMLFEKVVQDWDAHYSEQDIVSADTKTLRIPGSHVIPFHDKIHSFWHYWLTISVQTDSERDMLASESLSLDYIPWCTKCDKLNTRKPLLGCRLHGPSPANSGDRRRRHFKKIRIIKCDSCGMSYGEDDAHVCKRKCPHCYHRILASNWDTHVCFSVSKAVGCPKCGVHSRHLDTHTCNSDSISFYQKRKNDVLMWKLGKTKEFATNKYDGYIVWDLETFPCKDLNDRMVVYRCGLYHNTFAAEMMGLEGEYLDIVSTCPTASGFGDVIHRMLQYLAKPFFNNYIAISYFGCVFDHYLLLHDILSNEKSSELFRVSQPDFDRNAHKKKNGDGDSTGSRESHRSRGDYKRTLRKHQREDFEKSNWTVKSKRIFSMWLSEPVEDIAPRYSIKFVDLGLFTQCSLSQACKDFGLSKAESKDIFPHDFISNWGDLSYVGPVPDKKYFPLSCREDASALKWDYEMNGKEWDLLKVSEEYLRKDVMSTRQLFLKFADTLLTRLNICLTSSITLPSLAQKVLKMNLDSNKTKSEYQISLPSNPTVGSDFRKSIFGGRVMPLRDKFVSPGLEEVEASLVLLRRSYSFVIQNFMEHVVSRIHNMMVGHDSCEPEILVPLKRCLSEIISAYKTSAPENIMLLISSTLLPMLDVQTKERFNSICAETSGYMDYNDWVSIQYDLIKKAGCLRAVDVSSLYPHSMAGFDYPVGAYSDADGPVLDSMNDSVQALHECCDFSDLSPTAIKTRISDLRSRDMWPSAGIFYISYVPNQKLSIPVLPRKALKLLLWDLISSEGWYNSVDIETAIAFGYKVNFKHGYVWSSVAPVFKSVIDDLYKIKQDAENAGDMTLRSIAKLLMNSMYGKMLQKPVKESVELLYTDTDLEAFMKRNLWTGFESVGCSDICVLAFGITRPKDPNEEGIVEWDENTAIKEDGTSVEWLDGQPIQLGSFILGYSRRVMMMYFAAINPTMCVEETPFYTDTDSIFLSDKQYRMLEEQGMIAEGLGLLADDLKGGISPEAYFTNPKSYIVTKLKKASGKSDAQFYSHIKAKGIAKACLANTYKMGYMDEGDAWLVHFDFDRAARLLNSTSSSSSSSSSSSEVAGGKTPNVAVSTAAIRRGEVGMCCDPELFSMINEWTATDPSVQSEESPYVPLSLKNQYEEMTWLEDRDDDDVTDEQHAPSVSSDDDIMLSRQLEGTVLHAQTPDEKRDERLSRSYAMGKLDKESFIQSRRQFDGRSKRSIHESVTFPTFKRFLGRNRKDVDGGATNFSIVPRTISRSFGSRIYLGACFVPALGIYRPWNDNDTDVNGVGNAALARGGAKGEKWGQEFDETMDDSLL